MTTRTWQIDSAHSGIHFSVRHLVIAKVRGQFGRWTGALTVPDGDFTKATAEVAIDVAMRAEQLLGAWRDGFRTRFTESGPGNPVFSLHQTDIIYYGVDLRDYLIHEFFAREDVGVWPIPETVRRIRFWEVERFLSVRWAAGACVFDNSEGDLP